MNTLVDVRLLRKEPRLDGFFYEISHDSLTQPIARSRRFRIPKQVLYGGSALFAIIGLVSFMWHQRDVERLRARYAEEQTEIVRRAHAEAENLLSFLVIDLRDKLQPIGQLALMEEEQKRVNEYFKRMEVDKDSAKMLHLRLVSYINQGRILHAQGNLEDASQAYQNGLDIINKLFERNPKNTYWRMYSTWNYANLGTILVSQVQFAEAKQAYRQSLTICQQLAVQEPSNLGRLPDVSMSYEKVGDVLVRQGRLAEAEQAYWQSLAIRQQLVAQDPSNAEWQIDLVYALRKISANLDVASEPGKQEAKEKLGDALHILRKLQEQNRLAPSHHTLIGELEKRLDTLKTANNYLNFARNSDTVLLG